MNDQDFLPKPEYESLRKEMSESKTRELSLISISLSAAIIIGGNIVDKEQLLLLLLGIFPLGFTISQINLNAHSILRKAGYIRVFYEAEYSYLSYETALSLYRNISEKKEKMKFSGISQRIYQDALIFLGFIVIIYTTFLIKPDYSFYYLIILVTTLIWSWFCIKQVGKLAYYWSEDFTDKIVDNWIEIKKVTNEEKKRVRVKAKISDNDIEDIEPNQTLVQ